jgi:hypothetical protein
MANTRNRNTPCEYRQFVRMQERQFTHTTYAHSSSGESCSVKQPGAGFNPGQFSRDALSHNPVAIESQLFGIGATDLVDPRPPVTPRLKRLGTEDLYERSRVTYMPRPLVVSTTQRPSMWT